MSRKRLFSRINPVIPAAALAVGICLLILPAPAGAAGEGSGPIARTRAIGEAGRVDDFLSDVVPDWPGWSRRYWTDKELWGNQGYIIGGPRARMLEEEPVEIGLVDELDALIEFPPAPEPPLERVDLDIAAERPGTHRVVRGESLWRIAGYDHIYGNPLQWPIIYQANTDRIKNPDLIFPGQTFVIPRD